MCLVTSAFFSGWYRNIASSRPVWLNSMILSEQISSIEKESYNLSLFSGQCNKIPQQCNLQKKGFILVHKWSWQGSHSRSLKFLVTLHRQTAEGKNSSAQPTLHPLKCMVPMQEMFVHVVKKGLSTLIKRIPHRCTQKLPEWLYILSSWKLTLNITTVKNTSETWILFLNSVMHLIFKYIIF